MSKKPYRRRRGVLWRPTQLGVPEQPRFGGVWRTSWVNDGGEDAPLTPKGRLRYDLVILAIIVVGVALVAVARLT
jgi:hypothetical protein